MSRNRAGEHAGHQYRCWLEPGQGRYRGWYRGTMDVGVGDTNLIDRLHGSTDWYDAKDRALDEAEARIKAVLDEVVAEQG